MSEIPPTDPSFTTGTAAEPPPLARFAAPYGGSMESRSRPGLITAIGVLSIVVASISAICSLVVGLETVGLFMISKMASSMSQPATATVVNAGPNTTNTTVNPTSGTGSFSFAPATAATVGPNELPEPQRSEVVTAFAELQPLSEERRSQLTALLIEHGRQLFPDDGNALTAASVHALVKEKSSESAVEGKVEGSSWYVLPTGRITLFDDRAVFASVDGTNSFTSIAGPTTAPEVIRITTLTPQQVSSIVATVQTMAGGKLNARQTATLQRELSVANQQYIDPNMISSPAQSVLPSSDGTMTIVFTGNLFAGQSGGMMQIDPQGQVQAHTSATMNSAAMPALPWAQLKIPAWKIGLVVAENVASFGLAVYLFIIGILTLRQSLAARRLHLLYAWLKLPLAVAGGIAIAWLFTTFLSFGPAAGVANTGMIYSALWMSLLACAYPVALLITLSTRSMREYYKPQPHG